MTWDMVHIKKFYSGAEDSEAFRTGVGDGWYTEPMHGHRYFRWGVREDTPAGLLLNLRSSGLDDDPATVLDSLLQTLNDQVDPGQDADAEDDGWGDGWLEVGLPGLEAIAIQNRGDGLTPTYYLDELCRVLTARGWHGHVTVPPLVHSLLGGPRGEEPSIVTVLGYGVVEIPPQPDWRPGRRGFQPSWIGDRTLALHVAEVAVDWLEGVPGDIVVDAAMEWVATPDQARIHLARQLSLGSSPSLERLLLGPRPAEGGRSTRTGRVVYPRHGSLVLVEHEPTRPLAERLADHRRVLTAQEHRISYAFTTGTLGLNHYTPATAYMQREHLRPHIDFDGQASAVPYQLHGHSSGLPDVHYTQLFPTDWLQKAHDLSSWQVRVHEHGLVEVTDPNADRWFDQRIDPRPPDLPEWYVNHKYDATAETLTQARADFGDLLQRALDD